MKIKLAVVTILSIVGVISIAVISNSKVMALEYSTSAKINFTINPSISVAVSGDLIIDELAPGSSSDSNVINVTVLSNNSTGYVLSSTVGTSSVASTDLKLDGNSDDNTNKFTNLDTNKASLSNFDDNYWGYSYSIDAGANWISGNTGSTNAGYNGLPLYTNTGIKLVDTTATGTNTIQFKIGAKASNTQAAGEYTNTANFTVVGKAVPVSFYDAFKEAATSDPSITMLNGYYKMQDMSTTICNNVYTSQLTDNSDTMEAQLIDVRDNNVYWVAKLKDGHCWMTQNLDLNLDKDVALTSNDTDLREYGTNGYIDGYSCSNNVANCSGGVIRWMPERSTINAVTTEDTSVASLQGYWEDSANQPYSIDSGNWYWYGQYYDSDNCPSNSSNAWFACNYISKRGNWSTYYSISSYPINKLHGHVGNYYNWTAAIASNDSSSYNVPTEQESTTYNSPSNSVCPVGWRLPIIVTDYGIEVLGHNDFYNIIFKYSSDINNDSALISNPLYFIRSGEIFYYNLRDGGNAGMYWSNTVGAATNAYYFSFSGNDIEPKSSYHRLRGMSVRCLAR